MIEPSRLDTICLSYRRPLTVFTIFVVKNRQNRPVDWKIKYYQPLALVLYISFAINKILTRADQYAQGVDDFANASIAAASKLKSFDRLSTF